MKILLDTCVWGGAKGDLEAAGHEAAWVGDWPQDPGDEQILALAQQRGMVPITLDKDFGELAIVRGLDHGGIIRLVGFRAREQGTASVAAIAKYESELQAGAILTIEPGRVRIRSRQFPGAR